ncbi:MAG: hypothetical protein JWP31_249 [Aeromicrobium sp.]|nr:hypothetical protein [Aeromicrobium sp.]
MSTRRHTWLSRPGPQLETLPLWTIDEEPLPVTLITTREHLVRTAMDPVMAPAR